MITDAVVKGCGISQSEDGKKQVESPIIMSPLAVEQIHDDETKTDPGK